MATLLFRVNAGGTHVDVTEEAGSAVSDTDAVEVTIDLATTYVNDDSAGTRALTKQEALNCLELIKDQIIASEGAFHQ